MQIWENRGVRGYWLVLPSGHTLCLISAVCPVFMLNSLLTFCSVRDYPSVCVCQKASQWEELTLRGTRGVLDSCYRDRGAWGYLRMSSAGVFVCACVSVRVRPQKRLANGKTMGVLTSYQRGCASWWGGGVWTGIHGQLSVWATYSKNPHCTWHSITYIYLQLILINQRGEYDEAGAPVRVCVSAESWLKEGIENAVVSFHCCDKPTFSI